jgi:hypothetical protein
MVSGNMEGQQNQQEKCNEPLPSRVLNSVTRIAIGLHDRDVFRGSLG